MNSVGRHLRRAPITDADVIVLAAVSLVLIETVAAISVAVFIESNWLILETYVRHTI